MVPSVATPPTRRRRLICRVLLRARAGAPFEGERRYMLFREQLEYGLNELLDSLLLVSVQSVIS